MVCFSQFFVGMICSVFVTGFLKSSFDLIFKSVMAELKFFKNEVVSVFVCFFFVAESRISFS